MPATDLIQYINSLPLEGGHPYHKPRRTLGLEASSVPVMEGTDQSFFSEKSIVSFAAGVSGQNRQDILNTTLFAQMAANSVKSQDQIMAWYKKFIEVLSQTGWIIEGKDVQTYEAKSNIFEVENVVIDILTGVFGSNYIAIIKKTLDAIKQLDSGDKKIKAFENNVNSVSKGCFQIALANEENGVVSMQIGTFILNSTNAITTILFFKTQKNQTTLKYISKKATFNAGLYAAIRNAVNSKLGERLATNVAEITLD